jgi:hypothetical protein
VLARIGAAQEMLTDTGQLGQWWGLDKIFFSFWRGSSQARDVTALRRQKCSHDPRSEKASTAGVRSKPGRVKLYSNKTVIRLLQCHAEPFLVDMKVLLGLPQWPVSTNHCLIKLQMLSSPIRVSM